MSTFLRIPYENNKARETAKSAGAKWQPQAKLWKLSGDCPKSLEQFKIEVVTATYSLESLIDARMEKPLALLSACYEQADLADRIGQSDRKPAWQVMEIVGQTPLEDGAEIPPRDRIQSIARTLAARLLFKTGQRELATEILKDGDGE